MLEGRADEAKARLAAAIRAYAPREELASARMELELSRIELRDQPAAAAERAERVLDRLQGSGAVPLIETAESLIHRALSRV